MKSYSILLLNSIIIFSCDFNPVSKAIERGREVNSIKEYQPSDTIKRLHTLNKDKDCKDCHK